MKTEIKSPSSDAAQEGNGITTASGDNTKAVKTKKPKRSFAGGLNFYKLVWIFLIGSFLGVVCEVIFCFFVDHKYESRQGVIYGPFNPVYGVGVVLITVCLYWLRNKRDFWTFLCGAFLGAASEYICSWYQETFVGTVSWDYSNMWGNLNGRTCLLYAGIWGFLAMLWMKFLYPWVSKFVEAIPNKIGYALTWILLLAMLADVFISSAAVNRMTARHHGIEPRNSFEEFLDKTYPDDFLISVYYHMQYASDGTDADAYIESKASK